MTESQRTSLEYMQERSGSTTQLETSGEASPTIEGVLHLRSLQASPTQQHVRWTDDTIDNENMGKKKSNGKTQC